MFSAKMYQFGEDLALSGDCGGTNTRLSLWRIRRDAKASPGDIAPGQVVFSKKYRNEEHASFVEICKIFLGEAGKGRPSVCVLACAGPILNNSVQFTNVKKGWKISGKDLSAELSIPVVELINDFVAMGYGLLTLRDSETFALNDVPKQAGAPIATIGAGTGLGECFLTSSGNTYTCYGSEGGHSDFAPISDLEIELLAFIKSKYNCKTRISAERIISGLGLSDVYEFLAAKFPNEINPVIHEEWQKESAMRGAVVGKGASTGDILCIQAMTLMVNAYGREAGNAALKYLPYGGFYITGGLAPKNLKFFTENPNFIEAFFDKGRVSSALKNVPLHIVLTEDLGERGAHYYAFQLLRKSNQASSSEKTMVSVATLTAAAAAGAVILSVLTSMTRK